MAGPDCVCSVRVMFDLIMASLCPWCIVNKLYIHVLYVYIHCVST